MYKDYKIVVNTAAGRRRYMQYLIPYVVSSDIVDRYDIWVNTHNGADIEFFKQCAKLYPKINLVWQPDGVVNGIASINAFYKLCCDPMTIYFKLDDDIVWMEPTLIEKMVAFRVEKPQYFVVSPLVINNALSTYILQVEDKIKLNKYFPSLATSNYLWKSGKFAATLHDWFLDNYLKTKKYEELHVGKKEMGMCRFSINCILWFGEDLAKINGIIPGDDEEFLSCIYPTKLGRANAWNGDVIMGHFAFFTQRAELDKMQILERYGQYLHEEWKQIPLMHKIDEQIQQIMKMINDREQELLRIPSPYKKGVPERIPYKNVIKMKVLKSINSIIQKHYRDKEITIIK